MKKILANLFILIAGITLMNCEGDPGPMGPQGPQGPAGQDGEALVGLVYEHSFSLNGSNNWESIYTFPANDVIYDTDVVLVYLLWDVQNGTDIWRIMPVSFYYPEGIMNINYDYTVNDVKIFAEGQAEGLYNFNNLVARIAILPAGFSSNQRVAPVNYENYEEVKKAFNLPDLPMSKGTPLKKLLSQRKAK